VITLTRDSDQNVKEQSAGSVNWPIDGAWWGGASMRRDADGNDAHQEGGPSSEAGGGTRVKRMDDCPAHAGCVQTVLIEDKG